MAQTGQREGVALTSDDGADDLEAGLASDVRKEVVKLEVHLLERFLHMEDVWGRGAR